MLPTNSRPQHSLQPPGSFFRVFLKWWISKLASECFEGRNSVSLIYFLMPTIKQGPVEGTPWISERWMDDRLMDRRRKQTREGGRDRVNTVETDIFLSKTNVPPAQILSYCLDVAHVRLLPGHMWHCGTCQAPGLHEMCVSTHTDIHLHQPFSVSEMRAA